MAWDDPYDFTTFTENDANTRYSTTASTLTITNLNRTDANHWITKQINLVGTNFRFALDLTISASTNGTNDGMYIGQVFGLANEQDDLAYFWSSKAGFWLVITRSGTSSQCGLALLETKTTNQSTSAVTLTKGTTYYLIVRRDGTTLYLGVYSTSALRDAGDGTDGDIGNKSLSNVTTISWTYIYGSSSRNTSTSITISGTVVNLKKYTTALPSLGAGSFTTYDFTTFTENDPNTRYSTTTSTLTITALNRTDVDTYIIKQIDQASGDFAFALDLTLSSAPSGTDGAYIGTVFGLANATDDYAYFINAVTGLWIMINRLGGATTKYGVVLTESKSGGDKVFGFLTAWNTNTTYYLMVRRYGSDLHLAVYSTAALRDAGKGDDGDLLNCSLGLVTTAALTYIYGSNSRSATTSMQISGTVVNLAKWIAAALAKPSSSIAPLAGLII